MEADIKSLIKMMAIVDCFSTLDRKLSAATIAKRTSMPRPTTHRLLRTMRSLGLIEQERERDQYSLGMKFFEVGTTVLQNMDLHNQARSSVESLARVTGESVHLSVFDGVSSTVVNRTDPEGTRVNTLFVLESSPAHATATGKCALAFQPESTIKRFLSLGLRKLTINTITDSSDLVDELNNIRRLGYAIDDEELEIGTKCVAAPIRSSSGRVIGGISVSGQANRFTQERIESLSEIVKQYAQTISARLDYYPSEHEETENLPPIADLRTAREAKGKGGREAADAGDEVKVKARRAS